MPQVTGLSDQEVSALNDALNPLVRKWMEVLDGYASNKAEKVVFRVIESGLNMAEHLPAAKKLNTLVDGSNRLLPKLEKYIGDDTLASFIPPELKKPEIADLCEKAGAVPLAQLLRQSFAEAAAPASQQAVAPTPVVTNAQTQPEAEEQPGAKDTGSQTPPVTQSTQPEQQNPNQVLIDGFERFRGKYYDNGAQLMQKLVEEGPRSDFYIINCIDSRNGADLVFDAKPGQEFIHSQMGSIVPPYDEYGMREFNASLHYVIDVKNIKHVIIMGHSHCGGCAALVDKTTDPLIAPWVELAHGAAEKAEEKVGTDDHDALARETERQIVIQSLRNILEYPMVKQAVADGRITVNGWYFDMKNGIMHEYDPQADSFKRLNSVAQAQPKQGPRPGPA